MNDYLKLKRQITSGCKLPENLDSAVWHYMDYWKFQSLLQEKAIYLCRADHLQDCFEGTYSRNQINNMNEWFKDIGEPEMIDHERILRIEDRKKTYISCWCLSDVDLDLMWKAYIKRPFGVAIKSSVRSLQKICDDAIRHWPLDISMVTYFDHDKGENINYFGTPTVFLHKDHHFRLDNEIRIIHWPAYSTPPEYVYLPVDLNVLIDLVIAQPGSTKKHLESISNLCDKCGLKDAPIVFSRDDRLLIE